jgi:hypothetical protein
MKVLEKTRTGRIRLVLLAQLFNKSHRGESVYLRQTGVTTCVDQFLARDWKQLLAAVRQNREISLLGLGYDCCFGTIIFRKGKLEVKPCRKFSAPLRAGERQGTVSAAHSGVGVVYRTTTLCKVTAPSF